MTEANRVGAGSEMKRAAVEDPVDRSEDRAAVGGHGAQGEQAHAAQTLDHLLGAETSIRGVDAEQMRTGPCVAAVKQVL